MILKSGQKSFYYKFNYKLLKHRSFLLYLIYYKYINIEKRRDVEHRFVYLGNQAHLMFECVVILFTCHQNTL